MTSFFVLVILFFAFYQSINSQLITTSTSIVSISNSTEKTTVINFTGLGNETNPTQTSTATIGTTSTTNSSNITTKSTVMASTTTLQPNMSTTAISVVESTIPAIDSNLPSNGKPRSSWWLFMALIVTVVVVISIGVIYYHRRHAPYTRFLQNWRSRDDEADNIILQLEQPEITNGRWPPRISFA